MRKFKETLRGTTAKCRGSNEILRGTPGKNARAINEILRGTT